MRLELTHRGDYAVRAMLALSRADPGSGRLSVRRIAAEMSIPVAFLPRVMRDLVAAGLVDAASGRAGGYRLARPAADVSVLQIIDSVEGTGRRATCVLRGGPCEAGARCAAHDLFFVAREAMLDQLRGASLADLARPNGAALKVAAGSTRSPVRG
jgi:Rrf2 family protein